MNKNALLAVLAAVAVFAVIASAKKKTDVGPSASPRKS
jgi:hypothetical protein